MSSPLSDSREITLALGVKDRKASATWYVKLLGCTERYDVAEIGYLELATPVTGLLIGLADREEIAIGGFVPTFTVGDLDAARTFLERNGVRFDGPTITHEGMVKLATFYDPDGHALMLAESLQQA